MLEYYITATRLDAHHGLARCKNAGITLDTDLAGNPDAFNPAELLLAAVAACMLKGIERVMPILHFSLRGVELHLEGLRQDNPPKMASIRYEMIVDTDETDRRLELLHENVKKFGTIYNTVAAGTELAGTLRRKSLAIIQTQQQETS
ncbi:MAG: OsmC family protein [Betaproteobacteria bacterium]|nr:OsmC family protein [Betaproteobacteria bacterium]